MIRLGVNIDHVATLRQARQGIEPDPVAAAVIAELSGADGITVHLREDRRHINDRDVAILRRTIRTRMNLEMSVAAGIVAIACKIKPDQATLVPEKREEITTEGGLDVLRAEKRIKEVTAKLKRSGIIVSLFIEPDKCQIEAAKRTGATHIELHTGKFANARPKSQVERQLTLLSEAAKFAKMQGLHVNAGHGLNYWNTQLLLEKIPDVEELNIGHSIISRAVLVGLDKAVREMKEIIDRYCV
ncbi:MAG: pyridoxine 5'-phosphate synthase [Candidatus Omnitrophica bacterium]|nr:pyridoxine 5'-phosphate synthase [Candidatus Omnitrophota bacterium]MBU4478331.1 pyridoxine 5'-phosphate synthase [Candidatus Omnitrophota bacterium]MCG2704259.1 pyridoxine 5'-phosphate synthase [Candidatus Omnitrophota bacterium]